MRVKNRRHYRQPRALDEHFETMHEWIINQTQSPRQLCRHHHAGSNGFAVQPSTVPHSGLNSMAKCVAKIQDGTQARFLFVLPNHPCLDLAATPNGVCKRAAVTAEQGIHGGLEPCEELHVRNRPVFDDLRQTGAELARRQRIKRRKVTHHQKGLVKGPDHVLAQRVVDGRLASHRRVHLGQQCGGHLHERHATHVCCSRKPRHITDHAPTQGKKHRLAVASVFQQCVKNQIEGLPGLVLFAVG